MKNTIILTTLLLLLAQEASAAPRWVRWVYRASQVMAAGGHGADLFSTGRCLGTGKGIETNPLLKRVEDPILFGTTKASIAAGSLIAVDLVAEKSTKNMLLGSLTNFAVGSSMYIISEHNMRVCR